MSEPASIRYNNPGAMWGGNKIAKRWGALANIPLADGKGQGNTIAYFPTKVAGACAQFDLWQSNYCGLGLAEAIHRWSGGNSSVSYIDFLCRKTGMGINSRVTKDLLKSQTGIELLKAQASWEAGRQYPLTDGEWLVAQDKVFSHVEAKKRSNVVVAAGTVTATTVVVQQGSSGHFSPVLWGALAAVVVASLVWWFLLRVKGK